MKRKWCPLAAISWLTEPRSHTDSQLPPAQCKNGREDRKACWQARSVKRERFVYRLRRCDDVAFLLPPLPHLVLPRSFPPMGTCVSCGWFWWLSAARLRAACHSHMRFFLTFLWIRIYHRDIKPHRRHLLLLLQLLSKPKYMNYSIFWKNRVFMLLIVLGGTSGELVSSPRKPMSTACSLDMSFSWGGGREGFSVSVESPVVKKKYIYCLSLSHPSNTKCYVRGEAGSINRWYNK